MDDCFWFFSATLLKWGTASSVWKTSDEYSLSRNNNLRSTVQVYHFFLGSINVQSMFLLVYTVYGQKQPPQVFCKKSILKKFVNFTGKHFQTCNFIKNRLQHRYFPVKFTKCLRTPNLKNIYQRLLLYCTRTTRFQLSVSFYIQYFFLIITATTVNNSDVLIQIQKASKNLRAIPSDVQQAYVWSKQGLIFLGP